MVVRYRKKDFVGFLYILPWLIGFLIFRLYPFIMSFYYSFSDYTMLKPPRYVGLYNFIYMFTKDELFPKALLKHYKVCYNNCSA